MEELEQQHIGRCGGLWSAASNKKWNRVREMVRKRKREDRRGDYRITLGNIQNVWIFSIFLWNTSSKNIWNASNIRTISCRWLFKRIINISKFLDILQLIRITQLKKGCRLNRSKCHGDNIKHKEVIQLFEQNSVSFNHYKRFSFANIYFFVLSKHYICLTLWVL